MKTVILAGGRGTRLGDETREKPKPMVEVGGTPILVHIMRRYADYGHRDFIIALGYLGAIIEDYFRDKRAPADAQRINAVSVDSGAAKAETEDWKVSLIDTGLSSMTGGRLHRLEHLLQKEGTFMLTYGDGVADIDIRSLVAFHQRHGKLASVTAVRPPARFGELALDGNQVVDFQEKPQISTGWINGGYFVFEPGFFEYLHGDSTVLEQDPLENLAKDGQLMAFKHEGFWHSMDTVRDRDVLNEMWANGQAPWIKENKD